MIASKEGEVLVRERKRGHAYALHFPGFGKRRYLTRVPFNRRSP